MSKKVKVTIEVVVRVEPPLAEKIVVHGDLSTQGMNEVLNGIIRRERMKGSNV